MATKALRVLFVLSTMEIGGVQSGIMNFAKIVKPTDAQFDVLVLENKTGFHEEKFSEYGSIYHINTLKSDNQLLSCVYLLLNDRIIKREVKRLLKENNGYDVVHSKSLLHSAAIVEAAKEAGIPITVTQSHVDKPDKLNPFYRWYYRFCAKRIEKTESVKLAVSPKAADLMYGQYGGRVIKNPTISLKRFNPMLFNPEFHEGIRLIQVGTFSGRKNQVFSVKILYELIRKGEKAELTFVGYSFDEPDYQNEIRKCVQDLNLGEYVKFLPKDADLPFLLSEHDIMLVPSIREGLPNVALEAQAMGVPCFISDSVNPETDCGLVSFLPLESGSEYWADQIVRFKHETKLKKRYVDMSSWDNEKVVQEYIKIWRGE